MGHGTNCHSLFGRVLVCACISDSMVNVVITVLLLARNASYDVSISSGKCELKQLRNFGSRGFLSYDSSCTEIQYIP